jgi:hypothetical protein
MTAWAGAGDGSGPRTACAHLDVRRPVGPTGEGRGLADPLAGPPIVARGCAPDEGTGPRKWEPSKGASDR